MIVDITTAFIEYCRDPNFNTEWHDYDSGKDMRGITFKDIETDGISADEDGAVWAEDGFVLDRYINEYLAQKAVDYIHNEAYRQKWVWGWKRPSITMPTRSELEKIRVFEYI